MLLEWTKNILYNLGKTTTVFYANLQSENICKFPLAVFYTNHDEQQQQKVALLKCFRRFQWCRISFADIPVKQKKCNITEITGNTSDDFSDITFLLLFSVYNRASSHNYRQLLFCRQPPVLYSTGSCMHKGGWKHLLLFEYRQAHLRNCTIHYMARKIKTLT